ncbi:hypothetical protein C8R44DRAFT_750781 [Mycena epipterygia]|nr:hypothetical protein C8R44DRAFT_750781 [Mycena epipterygia]
MYDLRNIAVPLTGCQETFSEPQVESSECGDMGVKPISDGSPRLQIPTRPRSPSSGLFNSDVEGIRDPTLNNNYNFYSQGLGLEDWNADDSPFLQPVTPSFKVDPVFYISNTDTKTGAIDLRSTSIEGLSSSTHTVVYPIDLSFYTHGRPIDFGCHIQCGAVKLKFNIGWGKFRSPYKTFSAS